MGDEVMLAAVVAPCRRCFIELGVVIWEIRRLLETTEAPDLRSTTLEVLRVLLAEHGVVAGDFDAQEGFDSWMPSKCALDRIDSLWPLLMDETGREVTVYFGHSDLLAR
jgi:hypothetical protein